MQVGQAADLYHFCMTHLRSTAASRTLTVVLSESDWQALREVEPDAVGWLKERIRERLGAATEQESRPSAPRTVAATASCWGEDLY
jgi:hypothetical protein